MNRPVTVVGIVLLLIGLLVGYLWWGTPTERLQKELVDARAATQAVQRQLEAAQSQARESAAQAKTLEERLAIVEAELARERASLSRQLSRGRK